MGNREDRRKAMKQHNLKEMPRVKTYNISEDQVRNIAQRATDIRIEEVRVETIKWSTNCLLSAFVISLHHTMGYGITRLERVMSEVDNQFKAVREGTITEKDILQCAADIGVIIQEGVGVRVSKDKRNLLLDSNGCTNNSGKGTDIEEKAPDSSPLMHIL